MATTFEQVAEALGVSMEGLRRIDRQMEGIPPEMLERALAEDMTHDQWIAELNDYDAPDTARPARCAATNKISGDRCRNYAKPPSNLCWLHMK